MLQLKSRSLPTRAAVTTSANLEEEEPFVPVSTNTADTSALVPEDSEEVEAKGSTRSRICRWMSALTAWGFRRWIRFACVLCVSVCHAAVQARKWFPFDDANLHPYFDVLRYFSLTFPRIKEGECGDLEEGHSGTDPIDLAWKGAQSFEVLVERANASLATSTIDFKYSKDISRDAKFKSESQSIGNLNCKSINRKFLQ
jgi:hypothetical protein